jgi:carboxypeptidase family protein
MLNITSQSRIKLSCHTRAVLLILAVLTWMITTPLSAQQGTGNIVGHVTDSSGAVIADATIDIQNNDTQSMIHLTTDQAGFYNSPPLAIGTYTVTATHPGFTKAQSKVQVDVNKRTEVTVTLPIGTSSQVVEVTSAPSALNTTSATLGDVLEAKTIHELPLNGRNALALVTLTPGVRNALGANQEGFGNRGVFLSAISINGSPIGDAGFILDGQNNLQAVTGEVGINPTVDAIEEFKVQSGVMSAEYGYTAGGVVNLVSRSGTSAFHGTVYEFLRNDALDAQNYFASQGFPKPELRYNQFGAALGGPAIRQKAFFFGNWEEYHEIQGQPQYLSMPTIAERGGDFSHAGSSTAGSAVPIHIYDPGAPLNYPSNGPPTHPGTEFSNDVIPSNRIDPVSLAIQNEFYPAPNTAAALSNPNLLTNNYYFEPKIQITSRQALGRVDFHLTGSNNAFVRYGYSSNQTNDGAAGAVAAATLYPNVLAANRNDTLAVQSLAISDTQIISSSFFNTVLVGVTRTTFPFQAASFGQNLPGKLGLPTTGPNAVPQYTLPVVVNGLPSFNGTAGYRAYTGPQITDTASKTLGNHSVSFGMDLRYNIGSNFQRNAPSGTFNFAQTTTSGTLGGGNAYATFLLGNVSASTAGSAQATVTVTGGETDRSLDTSFFIQDDWQATPRLTINAGLRYDYQQQAYEQNNGYSNFNTTAINPVTGLPGLLQAASGSDRNFVNENYLNFGPRLGFALGLTGNGKSVLRGGYGIYYPSIYNSIFTGLTNGFSTTTTSYTTPFQFSAGLPFQPAQPGATPFPNLFLGGAVAYQPARSPTPMSQQWTLSLEQQIPYQIVLEATYAANRGTHFPEGNLNVNQLTQAQINQVLANPGVKVTSPCANAGGVQITLAQSLVAFPCYLSVTNTTPHEGTYNGQYLQLSAQRRAPQGLTVLFGYTVGKLLDDSINAPLAYISSQTNITGFQNIYNPHAEYSLDPTDVSQRATASALYDLPFGKGSKFAASSNFVNRIIGGFQFNLIAVFQTGFPLAISGDSNNPYATRPNFTPGISPILSSRSKNEWFNTAAFSNAPAIAGNTFGNVPRTLANVRSPGAEEFDISMFKTTAITERTSLQFRVETFNTFNHVNLGTPGTTFSSASASGPNNNTNFGVISTASPGRQIQLALKLIF